MIATEATRHPILFSAPLVRAILRGEKTQTRRVVNPQPPEWYSAEHVGTDSEHGSGIYWHLGQEESVPCPYGKPGDVLLVREAFRLPEDLDDKSPSEAIEEHWFNAEFTRYEADGSCSLAYDGQSSDEIAEWGRLRPSIHMPYDLCRIRLRVEDVRVERLQEITEEEIRAEGWSAMHDQLHDSEKLTKEWCRMSRELNPAANTATLRGGFATIWNWINADRGFPWEANPWVWVVEFSRITD